MKIIRLYETGQVHTQALVIDNEIYYDISIAFREGAKKFLNGDIKTVIEDGCPHPQLDIEIDDIAVPSIADYVLENCLFNPYNDSKAEEVVGEIVEITGDIWYWDMSWHIPVKMRIDTKDDYYGIVEEGRDLIFDCQETVNRVQVGKKYLTYWI